MKIESHAYIVLSKLSNYANCACQVQELCFAEKNQNYIASKSQLSSMVEKCNFGKWWFRI
jgi:hypothetical protein